MTIKQYQTLAKTIATKIESLGGNPRTIRKLKLNGGTSILVRNPKLYGDKPLTCRACESNDILMFDTISNPNNPNYKFKTLKPGSMSVYNSETHVNVDITDYNFDSSQFSSLIDRIEGTVWELA